MRVCAVLLAVGLLTGSGLAGCGGGTRPAPPAVLPRPSFGTWAPPGAASSRPAPSATFPSAAAPSGPARATTAAVSGGWEITVYYTAVETLHDGEPETVTGCRGLDCAHGDADLGEYPADFVAAVRDEGTGRTAAGTYLNWSYDVGYWLDTAARDTAGGPLRAFVSAAADPGVLPRGTAFRIAGCGRLDDGATPPAEVCAALRRGRWTVTDEFTPGLGGSRHVDVYIGEETEADFTASPWYLTLTGASLRRS
ncbi:hypothetical protein GCM10020358_00200 [Amorphoplanes nipponensis]|uniref:Uncharacterized protein n=1 Tax=Actinoplanes nipponensis TaxID=135950 RepID=A0A919JL86_9ACTN|nr:hypothetical protein [Actinoplanes nipponensis]GIE51467.1 hypothetical protein Ani05nite_50010 [Actinoplanes nipponensis]